MYSKPAVSRLLPSAPTLACTSVVGTRFTQAMIFIECAQVGLRGDPNSNLRGKENSDGVFERSRNALLGGARSRSSCAAVRIVFDPNRRASVQRASSAAP